MPAAFPTLTFSEEPVPTVVKVRRLSTKEAETFPAKPVSALSWALIDVAISTEPNLQFRLCYKLSYQESLSHSS